MENNKENCGSQQISQQDPSAVNQFEAQLDRFKQALGIEKVKGSDTKLAKFIGIEQPAIGWWRREHHIPAKWINKICKEKGILIDWLLTGEGPMRREEPEQEGMVREVAPQYPPKIPDPKDLEPQHFELVPIVEAHLSAGGGTYIGQEPAAEFYAFRTRWLKQIASSPKKVILMPVRDPSMEDTIMDGDIVLIDTGRTKIYHACIYAIGIGDTIALKRIDPLPDGRIRLVSDNPKYPPEEVLPGELRILGQVIWFARELIKRGIE